jgi:hypothetical protein
MFLRNPHGMQRPSHAGAYCSIHGPQPWKDVAAAPHNSGRALQGGLLDGLFAFLSASEDWPCYEACNAGHCHEQWFLEPEPPEEHKAY